MVQDDFHQELDIVRCAGLDEDISTATTSTPRVRSKCNHDANLHLCIRQQKDVQCHLLNNFKDTSEVIDEILACIEGNVNLKHFEIVDGLGLNVWWRQDIVRQA